MIEPCGHRLLVKPYKQAEVDDIMKKHKNFLKEFEIINPNKKREDASVDRGVVVSIGPTAWKDFGGEAWCKVGDEIFFAKFAGKEVEDGDEAYFILNDEDVVAVVKEKTNE